MIPDEESHRFLHQQMESVERDIGAWAKRWSHDTKVEQLLKSISQTATTVRHDLAGKIKTGDLRRVASHGSKPKFWQRVGKQS